MGDEKMAENNSNLYSLVAIALAIVAIVIGVTSGNQEFVLQQQEQNTLSTSGESEVKADPNKADIFLRIETRNEDAQQVQNENREKSDSVIQALKDQGVSESQIETVDYRLEREEDYNPKTREEEFKGYKLVNVVKVSTENLDEVGSLIDTAVESGANGVDRIEFSLSDSEKEKIKEQALKRASQQAKGKAEAIANQMGVSLGLPVKISESSFDYVPYKTDFARAESDAGAGGTPQTQIQPQKVEVRANVNVEYKIS